MSYPHTNVSNVAEDSATVGAQAQTIHGDVYTYFTRPGATAKEKYEVGVSYLNGGVPSLALLWIERAIAEGHDDTSEVRFHWLLALLSGRTSRQLTSEDASRLDFLKRHPAIYQSDPWADGIRAVLRLLDSLCSPGADPAPFIDELEHLHPAQKESVFQHITVFLKGPRGDQIWRRDIEAAETGRHAGDRGNRVKYFFRPAPAPARNGQPAAATVPWRDRATAFTASVIFVLALLDIGGELAVHASIAGITGFLVGCGGVCLAAINWVEFRWRARRRAEYRQLFVPVQRTAAPAAGFAERVDHQFDYYFHKYAPDRADTSSWISVTAGIRKQLRDEIVEIYREKRVKAEQLNWLISHEVRQVARRWSEGTFYPPPDDESRVGPVAVWAGIAAAVLGASLAAFALLGTDPVGGSIALVILTVSGYQGTSRWSGIALEHRRATADKAETERKFSERKAIYETWREKLRTLRPSDQQMSEWLECDKKVILKRALQHYGLNRSEVISYAFLETPSAPYERASVRNGPWRYTRYKIILFLLTADGIRQVTYELSTREGEIQQRDWRSYRYDALASVEASVAKDGHRQEFKLHLMNGQVIPFRAVEPLTEWNPDDGDADALSSATEDVTGLRNTLRILEGVAADGKGWIARETR